jgi:hypothetical protein
VLQDEDDQVAGADTSGGQAPGVGLRTGHEPACGDGLLTAALDEGQGDLIRLAFSASEKGGD